MAKIQSGDRCSDCCHCRIWSSDSKKASCGEPSAPMHYKEGFHPDQPVPRQCVGQVTRRY